MKGAEIRSLIATLPFFLVGYDSVTQLGVDLFRRNLQVADYQLNLLVVVGNVAAMVGAVVAGMACDYFGRKRTLGAGGCLFLAGNLFKFFATASYTVLMTGQVMTGLAAGFSLTVAPVYIAELVPSQSRGRYTALTEVLYTVGIIFGFTYNQVLVDLPANVAQKVIYGVPMFLSLMLVLELHLLLPESPYWLIAERGFIADAIMILEDSERLRAEVDEIVREMRRVANIPPRRTNQNQKTTPATHLRLLWKDFIGQAPIRRSLTIVGGLHILRQLAGVDTFRTESVLLVFLKLSKPLIIIANIMILVVRLIYASLSSWWMDRAGRRTLLLSSFLSTGAFMLLFGLPLIAVQVDSKMSTLCEDFFKTAGLLALMGIMAAFEVGLGAVTWTHTSEAFKYRSRAQGASIAIVFNRVADTILFVSFSPLCGVIGISGASVLFCSVMVIGFWFCNFFFEKREIFVLH